MHRSLLALLIALPVLAQEPAPPETVLPFINFPGCDTQLHLRGAFQDVTVEALQRGKSLGSFTLLRLQPETFWLSARRPAVAGEFGTLKLTGQVTALGRYYCDGSLYSFREGLQAPMDSVAGGPVQVAENYEVLEVAGRHLNSHHFWGHTYSYRVVIRNLTERTYSYVLTLIFRDSDGFAVATAPIVQPQPPFGPGNTKTFEGTIGGFDSHARIHFHHDPADITLDVSVEPRSLGF